MVLYIVFSLLSNMFPIEYHSILILSSYSICFIRSAYFPNDYLRFKSLLFSSNSVFLFSVISFSSSFLYIISPSIFIPSLVVFFRSEYFLVPSISPAIFFTKTFSTQIYCSPLRNDFSSSDFLQ